MELELNLVICRSGHRPRLALVVSAIVFLSLAFATQAQSIQLSAEQQRMLDQLPPEQRQQAVDALRRQQAKQTGPSQKSINETLSAATGSSDSVLEEDDCVSIPWRP
jgi:type II secretory pathway component PulL